jgi:alpha-D-ribose 1-methylphosphonate 5-triphosphate diphosphatase
MDTIDVSGMYVLPGLVDIHGDDIERYLSPRPEEQIPVETALQQSERAGLAVGVTTKFHAVAFEDTPDKSRNIDVAKQIADTIQRDESCIDSRVHARCEVADDAAVEAVTDTISTGTAGLVSVMNHAPGEGQYESAAGLSNRYDTHEADGEETLHTAVQSRSGVPTTTLSGRRDAISTMADNAGVPVASHDTADAAAVDRAADNGFDICEFPLSMAAARRATEREMTVTMGAPNLVRGGSLWDNLDAREAIDAGLVDVLCSDFRPQTLLEAAFVDTGEPLHTRVNRVTKGPADAVGLHDRGRLEPGERADIVVVDPDPNPTVSRVFVAGEEVYQFETNRRQIQA